MGRRRGWTAEQWADEARFIAKIDRPTESFGFDWTVLLRYLRMQYRFAVSDLGGEDSWQVAAIRSKIGDVILHLEGR